MWQQFLLWHLSTPWGDFSIGIFDGFLLWFVLVSVATAAGGITQHNRVERKSDGK
jgi:hypothetical protein